METKICKECGKVFEKRYNYSQNYWKTQIFCSRKCASDARKGEIFTESKRRRYEMGWMRRKGHIVLEETRDKLRKANLGKVLSQETKEKLRRSTLKQFEFGMPQETREKMRRARKGKKRKPFTLEWRKNLSIAQKKRTDHFISEETKRKIGIANKGKKRSLETIEKIRINSLKQIHLPASEETKRKMREATIKRVEKQRLDGDPLFPTIGNNEKIILDTIEKSEGIEILRQYKVIGYFLDGYCKKNNTAFEVDERFHFINGVLRESDVKRQKNVEDELGCQFRRIQDNNLLRGDSL